MTDTTIRAPHRSRLQAWAVLLSSLVIPLPLLVSSVTEAILDSSNPANVDVSQGLAYLTELLTFGFGSLGILLVAIVAVYVLIYRRERTLDALALPMLILGVQIVVGVVILVCNGITGNAENAYALATLG
ncbi:MAG: hypothetical protein ACOH1T_09320 [Microbacteriaceae bacterium]